MVVNVVLYIATLLVVVSGNELFHVFERKDPAVGGLVGNAVSNKNNEFQTLLDNGMKLAENKFSPDFREGEANHLEVQSDHPTAHKLLNSPADAINSASTNEIATEASLAQNEFQKLFTGPAKDEAAAILEPLNEKNFPLPNKLIARRRPGGVRDRIKLTDRSRRHLRGATD